MGVLAGIEDDDAPLNILLAKQHHINNPEFEDLKVDDTITIRVLGKKYEFGDSQIAIIGLLENEYIKQNEMLEDDDDDEDIEQLSNQGTKIVFHLTIVNHKKMIQFQNQCRLCYHKKK